MKVSDIITNALKATESPNVTTSNEKADEVVDENAFEDETPAEKESDKRRLSDLIIMPDEEPEESNNKYAGPYENGTCDKINVSLADIVVGDPLANNLRRCKRKRVESFANIVGDPLATSTHWWDD